MFWLRLGTIPRLEAAEEQSAITDDDSARNPPLGAALEQQGTNDLHNDQSDHEICNPAHRAWHHAPTGLQAAALLQFFIAAQCQALNDSETTTDNRPSDQPGQRSHKFEELESHILASFVY